MNSAVKDRMERKSSLRKREKVVELIEIDGKKVSITSTGKRKFHNKSKNGCDNCKRRRVKCDEGKPLCQKCVNMKLECVYTPRQPKKKKESTVVKYVTRKAVTEGEGKLAAHGDAAQYSDDSSCNSSRSASRLPHQSPDDIAQADLQERKLFNGGAHGKAPAGTAAQQQQLQQQLLNARNMGSPDKMTAATPSSRGVLDGLLLPPLGSESSHLTQQQ